MERALGRHPAGSRLSYPCTIAGCTIPMYRHGVPVIPTSRYPDNPDIPSRYPDIPIAPPERVPVPQPRLAAGIPGRSGLEHARPGASPDPGATKSPKSPLFYKQTERPRSLSAAPGGETGEKRGKNGVGGSSVWNLHVWLVILEVPLIFCHTHCVVIKAAGSYAVEQDLDPCMLDSRNSCYRKQNSSFTTSQERLI